MADFEQDAADLLARLVRFRTVNPPGDERDCQAHLAGVLRDAGLEVELLGRTEERPNLVARLRGAADGPRLVLLSHVDTVLAEPDDWQRDPWSGEIVSGELWGRGSQDMKSQRAPEPSSRSTGGRSTACASPRRASSASRSRRAGRPATPRCPASATTRCSR